MPHEHVPLAVTEKGELGPCCIKCQKRMTFGEAMIHEQHYLCWEHYVEATGADSATASFEHSDRFYRS